MKNKDKKLNAMKWAILALMLGWGTISFLVVIGEESSDNPMGLGLFMTYKFFAICSLVLCVITTMHLHENGWLPEWVDELNDEDL